MPKSKRTWVVVADGGRARIIAAAHGDTRMREVAAWQSAEVKKPSRELASDRQGRAHESLGTGTRHAIEPRADPHEKAKKSFVRDLAERIDEARRQNAFDLLVLVAPPEVLGELRQALPRSLSDLIKGEIGKDLTNTPLSDLPAHLPGILPPIAAARGQ